ncbi:hypothetical protein LWC33_00125 [Pseudonocardia sp. RS11V-5]|uniref:hypothetical protein n=1 Tax=Pseudonocardia terrae TaxID=2905831 RepID=UPI001E34DF6D|nr:hypothetical protein [Pseudonocardia terrae]MCE3549859.1 hypothetical protein [Pseudonocardia terrae]
MPTSAHSQTRNSAHTETGTPADAATATEARTSGPRQERPTGPEQGPPVEQVATELGERWRETTAEASTAIKEVARHNQEAAARAADALLELTLQLNPVALFGRAVRGLSDDVRPSGARDVVDDGFRMAETALATQRGFVDQVFTAQRRVIGEIVAVGESLTAVGREQAARVG